MDSAETTGTKLSETSSTEEKRDHLTIGIASWLRLLIVTTTCLVLVLAVAVAVRLLGLISHTLLIFALGALIAYALEPLVERVRNSRLGAGRPHWVGVAVVFGALFVCAVIAGAFLGNTLINQVQQLVHDRATFAQQGHELVDRTDQWLASRGFQFSLAENIDNPPPNVKHFVEGFAATLLHAVARGSESVIEGGIVLLIAFYFLIYYDEMRERFNRSLPDRLRPYVELWQGDVNRILGGFVRGQLILALVTGAAAGVACLLLGLPLWLLIGIFVVIASLIPVIGPYIGALPAILAALLGPPTYLSPVARAVVVIIVFFVINEAGSKILYPRLVGAALGLHEVIVLFVLFAGYEIGQLWGVLFAAPATALAVVTIVQLYRLWQGLPPISFAQTIKRGGEEAAARGTP